MRRSLAWGFHNIVGHPIMGVLQLLGCKKAGQWVHDATLPEGE